MTNPNREVIKAFYTPLLKYSRDQQGNLKPYPPTLKVNLRRKKDATAATASCFETSFYNPAEKDTKGVISQFPGDMPIEQVLAKRSMVTTIIQCTGVWFAGGKFGTTWKAVQARVDTQPEQIRGPAFKSDAPDIRAFVSKAIVAKASAGGEDEDNDEENDAEEEVPVVTKAAPAKVVAPAPVAAFDDEAVAEPLPVPKKVVKKVVPKAKA
jgi:hypothetical protein